MPWSSLHIHIIFEDLANFFKALIKFGLKVSPYKCQYLRDHLAYIGHTFMLKEGKPSCTVLREKFDAVMKMKLFN